MCTCCMADNMILISGGIFAVHPALAWSNDLMLARMHVALIQVKYRRYILGLYSLTG